jgi:ABC-type antimicrobial peptide transport system permease subunit
MKTLERQLDESLVTERMIASLSTAFGALATVLAVIGLYGVMAFMVTRRSREIGIRMALGAQSGNVVWLVMREVLVLVGVGIAFGLPAAFALAGLVRAQLYGIEPNDPLSIALATLLLAAVAVLAGYIPARRAATYDPVQVLRAE